MHLEAADFNDIVLELTMLDIPFSASFLSINRLPGSINLISFNSLDKLTDLQKRLPWLDATYSAGSGWHLNRRSGTHREDMA